MKYFCTNHNTYELSKTCRGTANMVFEADPLFPATLAVNLSLHYIDRYVYTLLEILDIKITGARAVDGRAIHTEIGTLETNTFYERNMEIDRTKIRFSPSDHWWVPAPLLEIKANPDNVTSKSFLDIQQ